MPVGRAQAGLLPATGADFEMGVKIEKEHGYRALDEHCCSYRHAMTEKILRDVHGSLFDFGAEDAVYEDAEGWESRLRRRGAGFIVTNGGSTARWHR